MNMGVTSQKGLLFEDEYYGKLCLPSDPSADSFVLDLSWLLPLCACAIYFPNISNQWASLSYSYFPVSILYTEGYRK
jgi:hypothetical protein